MGETNQPNEYGYAGGATTPEPAQAHPDPDRAETRAEQVAVPSGDLTGALSDGLDDMARPDDARDDAAR